MNTRALAFLPLLFAADFASAQTLYLTCKATSFPALDFKTIYRVQPSDARKQFMKDMIMQGLAGVLVDKAETWEIKVADRRIASSEENSGPKFDRADITDTMISASVYTAIGATHYQVNRINGKLTYRIHLADSVVEEWRSKHGGRLPHSWQWEQQCTSSSQPRF